MRVAQHIRDFGRQHAFAARRGPYRLEVVAPRRRRLPFRLRVAAVERLRTQLTATTLPRNRLTLIARRRR